LAQHNTIISNLQLQGNILDPPNAISHYRTSHQIKQDIYGDLLPAQQEFINDSTHRVLGYIGGFGSGKSFALCAKAIILAMQNPNTTAMVAEPSFPMIRSVFMPAMDLALAKWDIPHEFRISPQPEYVLHLPDGPVTILCQSAENWQRVRGQNISFVLWDECDTSPPEVAQKASEMFLARMRVGEVNQLAVASTPEGFRWAYRTFVENAADDKRIIHVKTRDNPNLPEEFITSLERNYPPQLIAAYLEGNFVNLASYSLYPDFDRDIHYTDATPTELDTIYVGIDLNVGHCVTQHLIRKGDEFHFFNEAIYRDTQEIATRLHELYPEHFETQRLVLIPDAASKQRSTAAAQESDMSILKKYGHKVSVQQSNPIIQDRINAVNMLISRQQIKVSNACPNLIKTFEQHSYDDKGRPEKGGVGSDDLSHAGDAAGYALYRLAPLRQWTTGRSKKVRIW
jgi:PBSX family phage terminase large subunit